MKNTKPILTCARTLVVSIFIFSLWSESQANPFSYGECSPWVLRNSSGCGLTPRANEHCFVRECKDPATTCGGPRNRRRSTNCDQTTFIGPINPNEFPDTQLCRPWVEVPRTICRNSTTKEWEQAWKRSCIIGLADTACSNERPRDN